MSRYITLLLACLAKHTLSKPACIANHCAILMSANSSRAKKDSLNNENHSIYKGQLDTAPYILAASKNVKPFDSPLTQRFTVLSMRS